MAAVTLSDGRVLSLDMHRVTIREFRALFNADQPREEEDATLARVAGLTADELLDLPQPDYRALVAAFFAAAREPLADPNSQSASSSA